MIPNTTQAEKDENLSKNHPIYIKINQNYPKTLRYPLASTIFEISVTFYP